MLVAIAASIHMMTTFAIPILYICYFIPRINAKFAVIILAVLLFLEFLQVDLLGLQKAEYVYGGRDLYYGMREGVAAFNIYIHYLNILFQALMIYVFYWFCSKSQREHKLFFNLWFFGLVVYLLLIQSPNVGRFSEFFYVFQIFAIALSLQRMAFESPRLRKRGGQIFAIYCICWYCFYTIRNFYGLQPYLQF